MPYLVQEQYSKSFDYSLIEHRFHEGPYELNTNVSLKEGDVVIDCGANMGLFSSVALAKGCTVFAFEPYQYMIDNFLKKISEHDNRLHIEKYALHNGKECEIELVEDVENLGGENQKK